MICGFLMIYVVEELAHTLLHKIKEDNTNVNNQLTSPAKISSEPGTTTTSVSASKTELQHSHELSLIHI